MNTFAALSTKSRTIGFVTYQWLNMLTTAPDTRLPELHHSMRITERKLQHFINHSNLLDGNKELHWTSKSSKSYTKTFRTKLSSLTSEWPTTITNTMRRNLT